MPIEQVESKIAWAEHHFQTLRSEVFKYVHSNPCKFRENTDRSTQTEVWGQFVAIPPVPPQISSIIGDILQSAHSSLDYLICELVRTGKEEPTIHNQFPIVENRSAFEDEIG